MNMSHEGRINALFVLCPWQHLQLFVFMLVSGDFGSTVWSLLVSQDLLGTLERQLWNQS